MMIEIFNKVKQLLIISILIENFRGMKKKYFFFNIEIETWNLVTGPLKMIDVKVENPFLIGSSAEVRQFYHFLNELIWYL